MKLEKELDKERKILVTVDGEKLNFIIAVR